MQPRVDKLASGRPLWLQRNRPTCLCAALRAQITILSGKNCLKIL